jgi:D-alanine-D-alanine ligase
MKIAVVYSSLSTQVFQHLGPVTHEVYEIPNINRIVEGLQSAGYEVTWIEADRNLINHLEAFFGVVTEAEFPGLVFNISFGMQGQLRYCHVPCMLEMFGIPYIGSGPLGHALATDKPSAKSIFRQHGLPTPDFIVIRSEEFPRPGFDYPLIAKPVGGASSFGVRFIQSEQELREAVIENLRRFGEPVLVEPYIEGREINVSIIGNQSPEALPVVEVVLGENGPPIYALEDKHGLAERPLHLACPAVIPAKLANRARELALKAFAVLGCRDWARVEFRIGAHEELQLLEVNTIPGLGPESSLPASALQAGIKDFPALLKQVVETAVARYQQYASFEVK